MTGSMCAERRGAGGLAGLLTLLLKKPYFNTRPALHLQVNSTRMQVNSTRMQG